MALLAVQSAASAQDEAPLTLSLSRDFGYSSGTGKIQGRFSMKVDGPDDLARVIFLIDGQPMGEDSSPPFRLQFETGSYPLGVHTLSAVGYTRDGGELISNEQKREFVSASSAGMLPGRSSCRFYWWWGWQSAPPSWRLCCSTAGRRSA